jgi:hypothetical protein
LLTPSDKNRGARIPERLLCAQVKHKVRGKKA